MFLDIIPVVDVETDACFEAIYQGDWVYYHFGAEPPALAGLHINTRRSQLSWELQNAGGIVDLTNMSPFILTVPLLLLFSTKVPNVTHFVMPYLRRLFWLPAIYNFQNHSSLHSW